MPLSALIEEVVAPHRHFGVAINVALTPHDATEPVGGRNPAILYGLGNLVENAVDFAHGTVEVAADWSSEDVSVTITDDGPGFAPEIMDRIGDPYVTSRRQRRMNVGSEGGGGLGPRLLHRQDAAGTRRRHAGIREPRRAASAAPWCGCAGAAATSSSRRRLRIDAPVALHHGPRNKAGKVNGQEFTLPRGCQARRAMNI